MLSIDTLLFLSKSSFDKVFFDMLYVSNEPRLNVLELDTVTLTCFRRFVLFVCGGVSDNQILQPLVGFLATLCALIPAVAFVGLVAQINFTMVALSSLFALLMPYFLRFLYVLPYAFNVLGALKTTMSFRFLCLLSFSLFLWLCFLSLSCFLRCLSLCLFFSFTHFYFSLLCMLSFLRPRVVFFPDFLVNSRSGRLMIDIRF